MNEFHIPVCLWGKISKTFTWIGDSTLSSISAFAELRNSRPIFWVKLSSRDCVKVLIFSFNTASTTFSFSGFSCTVSVAESLLDLPWSSQTWSNKDHIIYIITKNLNGSNNESRQIEIERIIIPPAGIGNLLVPSRQVARKD